MILEAVVILSTLHTENTILNLVELEGLLTFLGNQTNDLFSGNPPDLPVIRLAPNQH